MLNLVARPSREFRSVRVSARRNSFTASSISLESFLNKESAGDFFLGVLLITVRGICNNKIKVYTDLE